MRLTIACLFAALLGLTALAQEPKEPKSQDRPAREPLVLTYLANEGFLAEVGEHRLLFDAFLELPYAGYPALPADSLAKLRKAQAPFADVDLAVASHVHGDHFQPAVARDFLLASPTTPFLTTQQAAAQLGETEGWPKDQHKRVIGQYPGKGTSQALAFGELQVTCLRMPHGGMPDVENLAVLIEVGGHTLLHLGDSAVDPENFAPYKEALAKVDLVLAPVWFFGTAEGRAILADYLPAKTRVAMHFAKKEQAKVVASFLESHPEVTAFAEPLAVQSFE